MGGLLVAFLILVILVLAVVVSCIKIVPQAHAYIVERLGGYLATWPVGLHLLIPFIDRVAKKVTLKEQVVDFPPQPVITKDNVTMQIDTVVYFQITDPKLYAYGVENPLMAIENLTATTLRNNIVIFIDIVLWIAFHLWLDRRELIRAKHGVANN